MVAVGTGGIAVAESGPGVAAGARFAWPYVAAGGTVAYKTAQTYSASIQYYLSQIPGYFNFIQNQILYPPGSKPPIVGGVKRAVQEVRQ